MPIPYVGAFPEVGGAVVYHDERGVPHKALLTAVWGQRETSASLPCVNLVLVSGNPDQHDDYGRQIVRKSSCCHKGLVSAHGNYWRFEQEPANPVNPDGQF
jgi:hypothetical protein